MSSLGASAETGSVLTATAAAVTVAALHALVGVIVLILQSSGVLTVEDVATFVGGGVAITGLAIVDVTSQMDEVNGKLL